MSGFVIGEKFNNQEKTGSREEQMMNRECVSRLLMVSMFYYNLEIRHFYMQYFFFPHNSSQINS